jgi:hypothetical protein
MFFTDSTINCVVGAMFWRNKSINILDVLLEYTAFVLQALKSYMDKQSLTSPTSGRRSINIVRLRTTGHGVKEICRDSKVFCCVVNLSFSLTFEENIIIYLT